MASYAARHKAPPKHKARGRSMFAAGPSTLSTTRPNPPGGRRAAARPEADQPSVSPLLSLPQGGTARPGGPPPGVASTAAKPAAAPLLDTPTVRVPKKPAATKRSAGKPGATKPGATKPGATKPSATKPVAADSAYGPSGDDLSHTQPIEIPEVAAGQVTKKAGLLSPTFAAVTAASIGVTGAVGGGALLASDHFAPTNNLVLSDLGASGVLTAKGRKPSARPSATPRFTTRTVTPTPTPTATATDPAEPATGQAVLDRTAVERRRAEERATRARERLELGSPKEIAAILVEQRGWSSEQFSCLEVMWERESGWNVYATNPSSGAYGIPQALPGSKMASHGSNWRSDAKTQIEWGLDYISSRYSTPCGAWSFWQANNWY